MQQMFRDPFGDFGPRMVEDRRDRRGDSRAVQPRNIDPFGFGMFGGMFGDMRGMMSNMHQQLVSTHSYLSRLNTKIYTHMEAAY